MIFYQMNLKKHAENPTKKPQEKRRNPTKKPQEKGRTFR
jgi:hypothetical protein